MLANYQQFPVQKNVSAAYHKNTLDIDSYSCTGEQREAESSGDLQEALQERFENELATSRLIAEITDMRSRLDDLLAIPLRGFNEARKKVWEGGTESEFCCPFDKQQYDENTHTLTEQSATSIDAKDMEVANPSEQPNFVTVPLLGNKNICRFHRNNLLSSSQDDENLSYSNSKQCEDNAASQQDTSVMSMHSRHQEGLMPNHGCNDEGSFVLEQNVSSAKNSKCRRERSEENGSNKVQSCDQGVHEERRVSQECHEHQTEREASKKDNNQDFVVNIGMLAGCQSIQGRSFQSARVVSKPTHSQIDVEKSQVYNATLKQQRLPMECKNDVYFCSMGGKCSAEFLDAEKSLLASLERLDVKLSLASASIPISSRTSLISAGHQSTKSAPCVIRRKAGSDAYSINSTLFLSRPSTSHIRQTSMFSRRRQNIGSTNMVKDRNKFSQICSSQHSKRTSHSAESDKEDRKTAGTIIVHQNAEFLFR